MSIREITDTKIEQLCENCGQTRRLNLADLKVGVTREKQPIANVVRLPQCESCGSAGFLFPSGKDEPDHPSPGSFGHLHRILVDVLHSQLLKEGRHVEGIDPDKIHKREHRDEIEKWFKEGMVERCILKVK